MSNYFQRFQKLILSTHILGVSRDPPSPWQSLTHVIIFYSTLEDVTLEQSLTRNKDGQNRKTQASFTAAQLLTTSCASFEYQWASLLNPGFWKIQKWTNKVNVFNQIKFFVQNVKLELPRKKIMNAISVTSIQSVRAGSSKAQLLF